MTDPIPDPSQQPDQQPQGPPAGPPDDVPEPAPARGWLSRHAGAVVMGTALILSNVVSGCIGWAAKSPAPVQPTTITQVVYVAGEDAPGYTPTFGWVQDAAAVAANLDPAKTLQFDATPAGKAALGDEDVFLWQAVRKACNRGPPWYPNVNQQNVGCCVGCGWKHSADVCQATQILAGKRAEWKPLSVEVIYGESRVDVGGGRISGDGSVGAWAKEAAEKFGMAPMRKYDSTDLTAFSPARARQFGQHGVPADIKAVAKDHPVKGCALVKSFADVKRSVQQGYPVAVCSNQGFTMSRDKDGFARPQGTWAHCMAVVGVRGGTRPGAFILNSWGDDAHTGPVWPPDAPVAGFWADADVVDRMVRQGDSFALADIQGFPARKLDWLLQAPPRPRFDRDLFAALAW